MSYPSVASFGFADGLKLLKGAPGETRVQAVAFLHIKNAVMDQNIASWNQVMSWLRAINGLRLAA